MDKTHFFGRQKYFATFYFFIRVLEASIAENKASLKRTHTEVWSDSPNPHDRKRIENCPVGLKNVGNTCWFSAVIQVGANTAADRAGGQRVSEEHWSKFRVFPRLHLP